MNRDQRLISSSTTIQRNVVMGHVKSMNSIAPIFFFYAVSMKRILLLFAVVFITGVSAVLPPIALNEVDADICNTSFNEISFLVNSTVLKLSSNYYQMNKLSICIVSRHTDEISSYSRYSLLLQRLYSAIHGYKLFVIDNNWSNYKDFDTEDYRFYPKLSFLISILQQNIEQCEYVVWMDADFIPIDFIYPLENLVQQNHRKEIIVSKDVSNIINTGSLLLHNSEWTRRLLLQWLMMRHQPNVINDQTGFDHLFSRYLTQNDKVKLAILETNEFNSVLPAMSHQLVTDKFLHLAAEDDEYRRIVFCQGANSVASVIASYPNTFIEHFPAQLGLTRSTLLDIGVSTYGQLVENLKSKLLNHIQNDIVQLEELMPLLSRYRTVASKYVHALVNSVSDEITDINNNVVAKRQETLFSLQQRWEIVVFYGNIYQAMVVHSGDTANTYVSEQISNVHINWSNITKAWPLLFTSSTHKFTFQKSSNLLQSIFLVTPEMMKMLVEISYEYLVHGEEYLQSESFFEHDDSSTNSLKSQLHFTQTILIPNVLSILLHTVHVNQRHIVESMIEEFRMRYVYLP